MDILQITGATPEEIMEQMCIAPGFDLEHVHQAWSMTSRGNNTRQAVYKYQAAVLYLMARQYDQPDSLILEIGTYYGYTAAILGLSAPTAQVLTLNSLPWEVEKATSNLGELRNVRPVWTKSWDYLETYDGPEPAMVFIDGDHKKIGRDLPWWNWVRVGGLMLLHDYSPNGSRRACPPVYRGARRFVNFIGREPDVLVIDDGLAGMAGWYKLESDRDIYKDI